MILIHSICYDSMHHGSGARLPIGRMMTTLEAMSSHAMPDEGRQRVVIESVQPHLDPTVGPVKRVAGEVVVFEADVFADGHEHVEAALIIAPAGRSDGSDSSWRTPMVSLGNDRYRGSFVAGEVGWYEVRVVGWVDHFLTWRSGIEKKRVAGAFDHIDLQIGAGLVRGGAERARASGKDVAATAAVKKLNESASALEDASATLAKRVEQALAPELLDLMEQYPDSRFETKSREMTRIIVEPERAAFSAWYELFPRSVPGKKARHGTFADVEAFLPRLAQMGFDVLYLPPIHPIGHTKRKGKNNALTTGPDDPGSPWAIGSEEGGHTAIHHELGTLDQFRHLVDAAREAGVSVALDIAFQCSPDHPWVSEHPEWFSSRPDGSIQFAENPPKRYEDILPINFESEDWQGLWKELKAVFDYWIAQGVTVFRVDNPHTKSFPFWQWVISEIKEADPEVLFLSEAFTRPRRMYRLAKVGFSQSYTYFTWRTTKHELAEYFTELYTTPVADFFRPNLWPNTPDILHEYLQDGGRPAFLIRLILAATLGASYGIYGPAYELIERTAREPGSEEYLNSEKYQIRDWKLDSKDSIAAEIATVNRIRRQTRALQRNHGFTVHATDNDELFAFSKRSLDGEQVVLVVVALDYLHTTSGWVEFSPAAVGLPDRRPFVVTDLLSDTGYTWGDFWNFVSLDPHRMPAHILRLERPSARINAYE